MIRLVLFNGQGDYCGEYGRDAGQLDYLDPVPAGCFTREVRSDEELELLKSGKAQMRADGTLYLRR
jgi:hypothetical protein